MGSELKEEALEDLGLSKNEVKVYLTLLETGPATSWEISKKIKIHRTNTYDALNRLIRKGLIAYISKKEKKFYEIVDPAQLKNVLREKEIALEKIMPELIMAKRFAGEQNDAAIMEGVHAFQKILLSWLDFNEPILVYGIPKNAPEMMKNFIGHFHEIRIGKKIVMKHIYNFNAMERINYLNTLAFTEARYLPQQYYSTVSTNICGDEVALVLWNENPIIIKIKNRQVAESYRRYFEVLWQGAKNG
jgi:predicted transcriptional regulator